ncbi:RNA polymerase sigma-70 factor [uncultured Chitinophaga sp.]|jgi:RNA polymerase sigma-70 factor, Bacteroides expansion family 1|uniref:RNA polymerase sigma-70 factor n=1 Tax=uncultured Chitinophaga sp. TaxID=339340 RepID=UPI00261D07E0|nr:RNA polymerase sigma-70 factor [uncultured Chitinophaga sp.]
MTDISAGAVTQALRNHDQAVFQHLYNTYSEALYLLAYRWVKDSALAKDLVHNLFLHLWEKGDQITITGQVQHYLYRAVSNRAINELKRQSRQVSEEVLLFLSDQSSFYETADYILLQKELLQHVQGMPPRCREIFLLSRIHGLEPAEIATKLNISLNTVYFQLSQALKTLRETMLSKKISP